MSFEHTFQKLANPVYINTSCDFSVSSVNHMLDVAKAHNLGAAMCVLFVEDYSEWTIPQWIIRCEKGDVVSRGTR